jgi:tetratricopeptide (TPR) repeat protein
MDLFKLGTKHIDPFPFMARAYILESLGADEGALLESKEALRVSPDDGPAYVMLGKIYSKRKDYKKAFENYRLGSMYMQGDLKARLGLAQAYENLKDYDDAIIHYQRVNDASPKDIQASFGLARAYAEAGQSQKALDQLAKAKKLGLEDKVDVQKIRDIINSKKKKAEALVRKQKGK